MIKAGQQIAATDFIITLVAGEALSANDALYISSSDGKAYKTDADDTAKIAFVGFAQEAASSGANVNIILDGIATGFSSLTIGAPYLLSGTAGAITATAPTNAVIVGVALSATVLEIRRFPNIRTQLFTGSGTWTKLPGLKYIVARLQAGGGGGRNGGGGGAGCYGEWIIPASALGATETVTIGAAGSGAAGAATNGGATSLGTLAIAGGGVASTGSTGGAGGTASGSIMAYFSVSCAGGSEISDTAPVPDMYNSGAGGNSALGQGGQARCSASTGASGSMAGETGRGYGAGGSGSIGSGNNGGDGVIGVMSIVEFY